MKSILLKFSGVIFFVVYANSMVASPDNGLEPFDVYICSTVPEINARSMAAFYADNMNSGILNFYDEGEFQDHSPIHHLVILAVAQKDQREEIEQCLQQIAYFQDEWLMDLVAQFRKIGTKSGSLYQHSPFREYLAPLQASWQYHYGNDVSFASFAFLYESLDQDQVLFFESFLKFLDGINRKIKENK